MLGVLELPAVIPGREALPKRPTPWVLFYALRTQQIHLRALWCIKKGPVLPGLFGSERGN